MKPNSGIFPLTEKYLKTQQDFKIQNETMKLICIILLVVTCFNTIFTSMMVYRNSLMVEENLQLIQENRILIAFQQMIPFYTAKKNDASDIDTSDVEKFARMVDVRLPRDCPPCTTETPSVINPHKNPISILNELTPYSKKDYQCEQQCKNPPIHVSKLTVTEFPGKVFTGKGKSIQKSKQVAAYRSLEALFPEHLGEVSDENKPDLSYAPICISTMIARNSTC